MHFGPAHAGGAAGRAANLPIALPSAAVNSRAKPPGDALPHPAGSSSDRVTTLSRPGRGGMSQILPTFATKSYNLTSITC